MRLVHKKPGFILRKNQDIFKNAIARIEAPQNGCSVIIPHICNNIDVFGGGFSGDLAKKFPQVQDNFHLLGKKAQLGYVQTILVHENKARGNKLYVANMIAQAGIKNHLNPRPINYGSLAHCMTEVASRAKALLLNSPEDIPRVEIHAPKFGSGLAGGNWDFISLLIEDIWSYFEVNIYTPILK